MIPRKDNRGSTTADNAVKLVVGIALLGILAAFLLPVAVNAINGDTTTTIQQDTGTTVDVNGELNTTLDSVTAGTSATYTLESDGQSITNTVNVGSNTTYSFNRGDVVVTVTESNSGNATAEYEYAKDYAYSNGASALWGLLGLMLVLGVFLYVIGMALRNK